MNKNLERLRKIADLFREMGNDTVLDYRILLWAVKEIEQIDKLRKQNNYLADSAGANAHVIVEHGVIPGYGDSCRCEECRAVAISMDDAGYLDRICDQWWLKTNEEEEE